MTTKIIYLILAASLMLSYGLIQQHRNKSLPDTYSLEAPSLGELNHTLK